MHYRDNCNVVDNFNKLLALVPWPYDHRIEEFFYLVSCLRMATVNLSTIILELRDVHEHPNVRDVVLEIANALMK